MALERGPGYPDVVGGLYLTEVLLTRSFQPNLCRLLPMACVPPGPSHFQELFISTPSWGIFLEDLARFLRGVLYLPL